MKRFLKHALFSFLCAASVHAETPPSLVLSKAPIDRNDLASIKRGARFFATNCMVCHTLKYVRHDPIATEAGITLDRMPLNVKAWPFGITPPDLSLETNVRGVNWVYTYLHAFYEDTSRPTGVNNLLIPNTAMSGILVPYQGKQVLVNNPNFSVFYAGVHVYDRLALVSAGSLSPEAFDATTADVVNFLAYAAEPYRAEQHRLGVWVLLFLGVFIFLLYFLKREYWKDVVHKD
ncbi:MAG TPA: cytochrome c1 [Gammaproteobacteria bacterium]|jgi:ubiquinol-cytochrome c reductase cytochrome c1 subunit|nr:cytochrome c1 [Gammaproteobacteria bacterium]